MLAPELKLPREASPGTRRLFSTLKFSLAGVATSMRRIEENARRYSASCDEHPDSTDWGLYQEFVVDTWHLIDDCRRCYRILYFNRKLFGSFLGEELNAYLHKYEKLKDARDYWQHVEREHKEIGSKHQCASGYFTFVRKIDSGLFTQYHLMAGLIRDKSIPLAPDHPTVQVDPPEEFSQFTFLIGDLVIVLQDLVDDTLRVGGRTLDSCRSAIRRAIIEAGQQPTEERDDLAFHLNGQSESHARKHGTVDFNDASLSRFRPGSSI